jgi:8-oxo-dGTP pyrophosphatase MutT (NUDIX family)
MIASSIRLKFEPVFRRLFHFYSRFARPMTLGVRAAVLNGDNHVFLVKHSYTPGWHLPGGGVESGESMLDSLKRELVEEGGIELTGEAYLHGIYFNRRVSRRDHVAVYVVQSFRQEKMPDPNHEIIACGFFDPADLPPDTTRGTRLRLAEILQHRPAGEEWS